MHLDANMAAYILVQFLHHLNEEKKKSTVDNDDMDNNDDEYDDDEYDDDEYDDEEYDDDDEYD